jgi:hypothetical protein
MSALALFLFTTDVSLAVRAVRAGVGGLVVDWEQRGKRTRQHGADTEINAHTVEDLERLRIATEAPILCRVNAPGPWTADELEAAIAGGANEILVPMVRSSDDVLAVLEGVRGRTGVGILVETLAAVSCADELGRLPLSRVYVGLNDLAIERGSTTIFDAIADGTVERVRHAFAVPFGFAGLTDPRAGTPLPSRLLVSELVRLRCSFTFLRRSFHRDVVGPLLEEGVSRMHAAISAAGTRDRHDIDRDHLELASRIDTLGHRKVVAVAVDA